MSLLGVPNFGVEVAKHLEREQHRRTAVGEWQPIETAPKDGTRILVFDVSEHYGDEPKGTNITVVRYVPYHNRDYRSPGGYWDSPYGPCRADNATHWMPLPPPPEVK